MPYQESPSSLDTARDNRALAMTWERLKDKLRAHGVNGWRDKLPHPVSRNESADTLATWENEGGSKANRPLAANGLITHEAQRDKRIP